MNLAQRSLVSTTWNVFSNTTKVGVLFVRSIMLARILPVETFGVYSLAGSIVILSSVVTGFGMGGAFLHRATETENEAEAAAAHFTLKSLFTAVWAVVLITGSIVLSSGETQRALLVLTGTTAGIELAQTPQLILTRRVVHRRLALLQLLNALLTTLVALVLASQGITLWALLSTDLVTLILTLFFLYLWRPVWRPHLAWNRPIIHYFLRFGSRNFLAGILLRALDRIDDLWTGLFLGKTPLGYYSRAYTFATYPRRVLAAPINQVAGGTYAELKTDRARLSKAFFRANAFLVRTGFFFAGLLSLVAPEFIHLALGAKWLPMLAAFRLMLVYTLLDPIKITVAHVFVAVGRPERIVRARLIQLGVLVAGLFLLGPKMEIVGVALAVDFMLVVGVGILLWQVRDHVDFSVQKLFGVPSIALIAALFLGRASIELPGVAGVYWRTGLVKAIVFSVAFLVIGFVFERSLILKMLQSLLGRRLPIGPHKTLDSSQVRKE